MTEYYAINGASAMISPYEQLYEQTQIGTNHNGAPIYARKKHVVLRFDQCPLEHANQWISLAGTASHTLDIVSETSISYVTLSPVYVSVEEWPATFEAHAGQFAIRITNVV